MPNPSDLILGKRRGLWVRDAAKALIASTTPGGRFLILMNGAFRFQQAAGRNFAELAGFTFTSTELRWVFEYLGRYVAKMEWHLQPGLALLYEKERRKFSSDALLVEDETQGPITTERIHDGQLKRRVH